MPNKLHNKIRENFSSLGKSSVLKQISLFPHSYHNEKHFCLPLNRKKNNDYALDLEQVANKVPPKTPGTQDQFSNTGQNRNMEDGFIFSTHTI